MLEHAVAAELLGGLKALVAGRRPAVVVLAHESANALLISGPRAVVSEAVEIVALLDRPAEKKKLRRTAFAERAGPTPSRADWRHSAAIGLHSGYARAAPDAPAQSRPSRWAADLKFAKQLRDRVRSGEITCSVRIWMRSHVKVGGRYSLPPGEVVVDSLVEIELADITPELARRSGFKGVLDLLKVAKHGRGERVFLVEFHYEE